MDEMTKFRAEQRVTPGVSFNILPSAKYELKIGDKVLAYSEIKMAPWPHGCEQKRYSGVDL